MDTMETARFNERESCIGCGSRRLVETCAGKYDEGALKRFIDEDPWGEHPAPFLAGQAWSYVTCEDCSQSFHRYILTPEWNERRFSRWMSQEAIQEFERRMEQASSVFRKAVYDSAHILQIEQLTRALRGDAKVRLLDFGCGYGRFLALCSLFGFEACGVDRSAARQENRSHAQVFPTLEDAAAMAPFHAVTLFQVLEHLDDPRAELLRLKELLLPGGILVLEVPDCSGVREIASREDYLKIHPLEHINAFTPETLRSFAGRLGFQAIPKPVACVSGDSSQLARKLAKQLLSPWLRKTTEQYFRKP